MIKARNALWWSYRDFGRQWSNRAIQSVSEYLVKEEV